MGCWHKFMDGFGMMGDALTCVKCGYSKYPEVLSFSSRLFSERIKNDGTFMSFNEYPFIRKFSKKLSFGTDTNGWTHFYDRKGRLVRRK